MTYRKSRAQGPEASRWVTVHGAYADDGSWDPGVMRRVPADEAWKLRSQAPQRECSSDRSRAYSRLMAWLWSQRTAPTAREVADSGILDALPDGDTLAERLTRWPEGQPYPPLPDDVELSFYHRTDAAGIARRERWWTPGVQSGGARSAVPRIGGRVDLGDAIVEEAQP